MATDKFVTKTQEFVIRKMRCFERACLGQKSVGDELRLELLQARESCRGPDNVKISAALATILNTSALVQHFAARIFGTCLLKEYTNILKKSDPGSSS